MHKARAILRWSVDRYVPAVVVSSGFAVLVLGVGHRLATPYPSHRFLLWNLFLAWVPFVAAICVDRFERAHGWLAVALAGVVWVLFLPNAPYLVSDLTHLRGATATPWLDLGRLVAFTIAGCVLAVASLRIVQATVARRAGAFAGWVLVVVGAAVSGFGVALGRFGRLNSWEVVTRPHAVIAEAGRIAESQQALAVAGFFSLLVLVSYVAFGGWPARHGTP